VTAYAAVKAGGLTVSDDKAWKFIFIHWMMAFKLSSPPEKKILIKNMKGLYTATSSAG